MREFLYTRAGGVRFGTARLLDYEVTYDRMLYRFADFNAGYYASRNAAFQEQLARLSGRKLALDGDLLFYDDEGQALDRPSATLGAAVEARHRPRLEAIGGRDSPRVRGRKAG